MRTKILDSLHQKYLGVIAEAEANIEIYLRHPAGIGEHPDVIGAIDSQEQLSLKPRKSWNYYESLGE